MGTNLAPILANIYMAMLEEELVIVCKNKNIKCPIMFKVVSTCLSGGFLRIKFRFFSEFVNESSFSENENLGISFERFLPIFQNPHACTGGQSQQTIAPVSFQNYTRSSNPSSQKTESLFQKNWKEIEFPFNLKSSKLAARTSTIISKKKN